MGVRPRHPTAFLCRRGRRRSQGRHATHEVWSAGILARIVRHHTNPTPPPMPARAPALPGKARATRSLVRGHPCPHCPSSHHPTTIPCRRGRRRFHVRHAPHEVWSTGIQARILRHPHHPPTFPCRRGCTPRCSCPSVGSSCVRTSVPRGRIMREVLPNPFREPTGLAFR